MLRRETNLTDEQWEKFRFELDRLYLIFGERLKVEWDYSLGQAVIRPPADATDLEKILATPLEPNDYYDPKAVEHLPPAKKVDDE